MMHNKSGRGTASPFASKTQWRIALAMLLLSAAALRLYGINFGLPALLDPDELIFIGGAHQLVASGTLNPGWFGHPGTTTIYVLSMVAGCVLSLGLVTGQFVSPDAFIEAIFLNPGLILLPARVVMVAFSLTSIWLTYRLGTCLCSRMAGFAAATLLAFNPVHIGWSQVVRSDIMALTFLLLAALASHKFLVKGRRRDLVLACLATALAITSKWPFALAFLSIVGALLLRSLQEDAGSLRIGTLMKLITGSGVLVLALVVAISPHLILDYPTLLSNLQGEAKVSHLGGTSPGLLDSLGYYLTGPLWRGLGPLGCLLAALGLLASARNKAFWAIAGVPAAVMMMLILSQTIVWERWAIPLYPALSIAAGIAVQWLWDRVPVRPAYLRRLVVTALGFAVLAPLLLSGLSAARERINDNRRLASNWARSNLPANARLMVEHFAFDLVDSPFTILFPIGTGGCFDARAVLNGQIDYKKVDTLRGGHSNLDYAAVPDEKLDSCTADFAILTEHARYAAERKAFPEGAERYRKLIAQNRIIARFPAIEGQVGGRPEVYVLDLRHKPHAAPAY